VPEQCASGAESRRHAHFRAVAHGIRGIDGNQHQPPRALLEALSLPVRRGGAQGECRLAVGLLPAHGGGKSGSQIDGLKRFAGAAGGAAGAAAPASLGGTAGAVLRPAAAPLPKGSAGRQQFAVAGGEDAVRTFFLR